MCNREGADEGRKFNSFGKGKFSLFQWLLCESLANYHCNCITSKCSFRGHQRILFNLSFSPTIFSINTNPPRVLSKSLKMQTVFGTFSVLRQAAKKSCPYSLLMHICRFGLQLMIMYREVDNE